MGNIESSLFNCEKTLIKEAEGQINSNKYDEKALIDLLNKMIIQFNKLVRDSEKIVKISDGQQEHLHKIQRDLKWEIEANKRLQKNLKYIASIDLVTGCFCRSMGITLLENEINNLRKNGDCFSICYVDINDLKYIRDTLGHFESDELIVIICEFIKKSISDKDVLCRLGEDEFQILFPNCQKENAEKILSDIVHSIENENIKHLKPYNISFSYGIIQVNADDNYSIDYIIR